MSVRSTFSGLDGWAQAALALVLVAAAGCAGKRKVEAPQAPPPASESIQGLEGGSRCDVKGHTGRDAVMTTSLRARAPNVRRIFETQMIDGEMTQVLVCREADTNLDGLVDVVRIYEDGQAVEEQVDSDRDGAIDTWIAFASGRISRVELDRNGDGKRDERSYFVKGKKVRAEIDTNGDGLTDIWEIYSQGVLQRRGVDLDGDEHVDCWDRDEVAFRRALQLEEDAARKAADAAAADAAAAPAEESE